MKRHFYTESRDAISAAADAMRRCEDFAWRVDSPSGPYTIKGKVTKIERHEGGRFEVQVTE